MPDNACLETPRLYLRPFVMEDVPDLAVIFSDPDVMHFMPKSSRSPEKRAEATIELHIDHWQEHGFGFWAMIDKANNCLMGEGGLMLWETAPEVELGYLMAQAYWDKGIATELAQASLAYGFETLDLERIVAVASPGNRASRRVMEKVGMTYEKRDYYYGGECVYYAINRDRWQSVEQSKTG